MLLHDALAIKFDKVPNGARLSTFVATSGLTQMFAGYGTLAVCIAKALNFVIENSLCRSEFIRELFWSLILFIMGIRG